MGITPNSILNTGAGALKTFQLSLSTIGHNIANVQTPGYSRQRVELSTSLPFKDPALGAFGTGVQANNVVRLRSSTLDATIRTEQGQLAQFEQFGTTLRALETIVGDATSPVVTRAMTEFFNAWQDLSVSPEEPGTRQTVLDRGIALADILRDTSMRIQRLEQGINGTVVSSVDEANTYIRGIALLNAEIQRFELNGQQANDLRDRRDLLVENLSKLTDINVEELSDGTVNIDVNGDFLVEGTEFFELEAVDNGFGQMTVELDGAPLGFTSGRFQGFVDSFEQIDFVRERLNEIAETLINSVNDLHSDGFDLQGDPGGDFFDGIDASDITINDFIRNNPLLIAASGTGAVGNNEIALQVAQLARSLSFPEGDPQTSLIDAFNNLALSIGSKTREVISRTQDFATALDFATKQRDAISGVSIDEEMTNLLSFQRAFEAASRLITTVDELMDRLINRTGRVGV